MGSRCDVIGETGLQFYGRMAASISHEIKNALAIINENAGLLEDYTLMGMEGMPIDLERLKTFGGRIGNQVRRADAIVQNLNRLAHSIDESVKNVDLADVLVFVAALAHRFASARGVTLESRPSQRPVVIATSPFFLENLVWLCLDFAMDAVGSGKTVGLVADQTEDGGLIKLTLQEFPKATAPFPGERENALLNALEAELSTDVNAGEIVIKLPGRTGR
jgi:C4-dicarboxylate-specific signal transduction histidine kinase